MSARAFIDTNVFIYALAQGDLRSAAARKVVTVGGVTSVQVLNEFVSVSRRKLGLSWTDIAAEIELIKQSVASIVPLTTNIHDDAREIAGRYKIAFYDALLIAAAVAGKCNTLFTEDLQNGATLEGVTICNPFL